MKYILFPPEERRARYRFVSEPLRQRGHDVDVIFNRPFTRFLAVLLRLLFVRQIRYDGVITIGLGSKNILVLWVCRLRGWPVVARLGGDPIMAGKSVCKRLLSSGKYAGWLKRRTNLAADAFLLARVDGVLVVNEALKEGFTCYTKPSAPIRVAPQFTDGSVVERSYSFQEPIQLLTVTNLRYPEKADGVSWLVDQLAVFVREQERAIQLQVAGNGMELDRVRQHIEMADLPSNLSVNLLGFVEDVTKLYSLADIFVYRSFLDGTPNVILESKRFSLPLLANACEEFRTIVTDGETGCLYDNENSFQELLSKLCTDSAFREKLGTHAAKEFMEHFSKHAVADKLEQALSMMNTKG